MTLVVEGVVRLSEALLEELLAVERIVLRNTAGRKDAADVVIADGVIHLQAEVLFGLVVEVEEGDGALRRNGEGVEDVVATIDGEVRFDVAALLEGHVGADHAVELGLKMGVGEEEEGEGLLRRRERSEGGRWDGGGETGRSEQSQKLSAAG